VFRKTVIVAKRNKKYAKYGPVLKKWRNKQGHRNKVFAQNSFEKRQATSFRFSNEFCENPENVAINRKEGEKSKANSVPTHNIQKSFANSKVFGVKWLRIYKFNLI
jgi:hypothetical protein